MKEPSRCPTCDQPLTAVGRFFICPQHGQVSIEKPFAPMRIFLSYGNDSNEELVRRIKTDLEKRGHDVWFDKSDIRFGDDWRRSIIDGIVDSNRVLSFLSKHSTRDPGVCLDELAIAIGVKGGNIQTILLESETEVKPPPSIGHIQWLDMHDWKDRRAGDEGAWEVWYQGKLTEIVRVVESDESRRFSGEIETLNGHLKPISSDSRISALLSKGFFGRAWLLDGVEQWRTATDRSSRLFWITGEPGVGKSAFAAHLTHFGRDKVVAAQFVEWDKPGHRSAQRVVRSLAFQLATRLPDYRKLLLTLPEIAELDRKSGPAELFDYLLANPLKSVIDGGRERSLIVIDALDEAGDATSNPLVEMLARHVPTLPRWLGLVVTGRPDSAVKTPLQGLNPFVLDAGTEENREDIRTYLRHQLAAPLTGRPDSAKVVDLILEKSEGVFLYAERFCDDVQRGHLTLDHPEEFPQGLGGTYSQWFLRQFPDVDRFRREVRSALRAILAAHEPLPLGILQQMFNWQAEQVRDFTRTLGSLFPVIVADDHEVIKPYHKSIPDWLADEAKAGPYFVDRIEGHRQLANAGLAHVLQDGGTGTSCAESGYWARSILYHLCALKDWDNVISCLAEPRLFQKLWPGSYGLEVSGTCWHSGLFRNIWPESSGLDFYTGGQIAAEPAALRPQTLDEVPDTLRSKVTWAIADALVNRARDLQLQAFSYATTYGGSSNTLHGLLKPPVFYEFRDLVYVFAAMAGLAPTFAVWKCLEPVGDLEGKQVLAALGPAGEEEHKQVLRFSAGFKESAKRFLNEYSSVRSYIRYLAYFAKNEGWSGALEDEAHVSEMEWRQLVFLAFGKQSPAPETFIKMSDLGYAIANKVDIEPPWGVAQTKEAGVDAFLVVDQDDNGERQYYMVQMDSDGDPVGYRSA
jgi:hypothetical protein